MGKLTRDEISKQRELEGELLVDLPRDAHSVFRFEVKENIEDIFQNMKDGAKGRYPKWDLKKDSDGNLCLWDIDFYSYAVVTATKTGIEIDTANGGYTYKIKPNGKGGSSVEFDGPVHGLLAQNLLPKMTYVPNTLEGKFVDGKTHQDLTPYVDMETFGKLRAEKNNKKDEYGEKGNSQDRYGVNINRDFNNELPFFSKWLSGQELKEIRGQDSYGKPASEWKIEQRKEEIANRLAERQKEGSKVSGVVEADRIAEKKIAKNKETKAIMDKMVDKSR